MKQWLFLLLLHFTLLHTTPPKIAIVLSGGGARGMAQIGMLKVIDEVGIKPDYIIGTSMGAVIGGLYAAGYSAIEIEQIARQFNWENMVLSSFSRGQLHTSRKKWLPTGNFYFPLNDYFLPSFPQGMTPGNNIHLDLFWNTWHVAHINDFSQLPIPLKCVATDLVSGKLILYDQGSLADAIRASSSMPSVFLPFDVDDMLLIDGGLSQNFPADIAKELGCDIVIGLKTNTELSAKEDLQNYLSVLNQTINIGMTYKQDQAEQYADLIITQNAIDFRNTDFHRTAAIIEAGYNEALKHKEALEDIAAVKEQVSTKPHTANLPDKVSFATISVKGNDYLSATTIRNYLGLTAGTPYGKDEVTSAFRRAYSTELFDQIYPNIVQDGDTYHLIANVKERQRSHMGINFTYNQHDDFVAGVILRMKNVLLRNSNLMVNTQFGGKQTLELDYSKYIYSDHTMYYRLFPYYKSENIYYFGDKYERTQKLDINEYGVTGGLGFHFIKDAFIEPYLYSYKLKYAQSIGSPPGEEQYFKSTGVGIKLYYENLDDYPYYMKGVQVFTKWATAQTETFSDIPYSKMISTVNVAIPLNKNVSAIVGGEYGTFFKSKPIENDPFFIGGIDNFIGLNPKELPVQVYRKLDLGLRINTPIYLFFDAKTNIINYGNSDKWPIMDEKKYGYGVMAGLRTVFGPIRAGLAINNDKDKFYYVSIGFDYDAFMPSRR